jgi:hypothetical protein
MYICRGNRRTGERKLYHPPLCMDAYKPGAGCDRGDILANPVAGSLHVILLSDRDLENFHCALFWPTHLACISSIFFKVNKSSLIQFGWSIVLSFHSLTAPTHPWKKIASARLQEDPSAAASRKSSSRRIAGYDTLSSGKKSTLFRSIERWGLALSIGLSKHDPTAINTCDKLL